MIEDWKIVDGYGWDYWVSSKGQVCSFKGRYPIILKTAFKTEYPSVNLLLDGVQKTIKVHRLVAEAFLENPDGLRTVNHKDGDKWNNHVSNLEWASYSENNKHAHYSGLKRQIRPVVAIPIDGCIGFFFPSQAYATRYGFSQSHISAACLGKLKYHGGYRWACANLDIALGGRS